MPTMNVLDAAGQTVAVELPNADGRQAAASSRPVTLATEDKASLDAITTAITAASSATQPVSGNVGVTGSVAVTGPLTDAQLRATALPVSVSFPATQPVSIAAPVAVTGTFWQATQPVSIAGTVAVSGPLTDAQLRATAVPVSAASLPLPSGAATAAKQDEATAAINALRGPDYETVAAGQTAQPLGATGAAGDLLTGLLIVPASTSPGAVSIADGAGGAITVFAGGATSVATLHPFFVPLGAVSATGGWSVTTGANVSVIAVGNFT